MRPRTPSSSGGASTWSGSETARLLPCARGGPTLAGGFALATPFGVIYSTNLTADPETGVGRLSADQFYAALHRGVGPKGGQIYPAMPYNYLTRDFARRLLDVP